MNLILAADENWNIGKNGDLLCFIPTDLAFFKEKTLNKTVVMGRKTLESLPGGKPLPKRRNIVLTRNKGFSCEGVEVVTCREELKKNIDELPENEVFIIGGGQIYRDFYKECDICYITKIFHKFEDADTSFVNLDEDDDFEARPLSPVHEENGYKFQMFEYVRKK